MENPIQMRVEIRRNADGVVSTEVWPNWVYNQFWWEHGNAACDCNRELFFSQAQGDPEPKETECGNSRYSVRLSNDETRQVLYDEISE